jgi:hypothetical protein
VRRITAALSQPRDDLMLMLNEALGLYYMPLGFCDGLKEKIAVHFAKIGDNLSLRLWRLRHNSEHFQPPVSRGAEARS